MAIHRSAIAWSRNTLRKLLIMDFFYLIMDFLNLIMEPTRTNKDPAHVTKKSNQEMIEILSLN